MNFKAIQWSKALGFIAGGGLTVVFALGGPKWASAGPVVIAMAALLNTLIPSPAKTITPDMPVIGPDGTANGALNVTTTSTPPIVAVTKGNP
jgi:hypothetical protein